MLHTYANWINSILFNLLDGTPLINTPWIIVWVLFWVAVMSYTFVTGLQWLVSHLVHRLAVDKDGKAIAPQLVSFVVVVITLALFLAMLLTTLVPVGQAVLLSECHPLTAKVATLDGVSHSVTLQQCRYKNNLHEQFGSWEVSNPNKN